MACSQPVERHSSLQCSPPQEKPVLRYALQVDLFQLLQYATPDVRRQALCNEARMCRQLLKASCKCGTTVITDSANIPICAACHCLRKTPQGHVNASDCIGVRQAQRPVSRYAARPGPLSRIPRGIPIYRKMINFARLNGKSSASSEARDSCRMRVIRGSILSGTAAYWSRDDSRVCWP